MTNIKNLKRIDITCNGVKMRAKCIYNDTSNTLSVMMPKKVQKGDKLVLLPMNLIAVV